MRVAAAETSAWTPRPRPKSPTSTAPRSGRIRSPTHGEDVLVEAEVLDESGVFVMTLWYRQETSVEYQPARMDEVGETDGWVRFQGRIRGDDVASWARAPRRGA